MPPFIGRLVKSSALALFVKVAGALLSYVMFVALARAMSLEQFGYFSFAFSISVIMSKIAVAGQQQIMLRDIPRQDGSRLDNREREIITTRSYATVLVLSAFLVTILAIIAFLLTDEVVSLTWTLFVAALFIPIMAFSELQTSILRAYDALALGLAPRELIWRGLVCLICFIVVWASGPVLSAAGGFAICAGILAISTLAQSCLAPGTRFWKFRRDLSRIRDKEWLQSSAHFWISTVVTFGAPMLSIVIVGLFLSPLESGSFFAALKSSQTINLVLMATNIVASPLISRHFWSGEMKHVQAICSYCALVGGFFAFLVFLIFLAWGGDVLSVFGSGYEVAHLELIILSFGYVINAAAGPNGAILEMTKHQDRFMRVILISNGIGIVSLPILTGIYGTTGAAISVCSTLILWNIFASRAAVRHAKVNPTIFGAWKSIASTLGREKS